jgi:hypothetical protein
MPVWLSQLFAAASEANVSKANALTPLGWLIATLGGATMGLAYYLPPSLHWLLVILVFLIVALSGFFCFAYFHYMRHEPDALRSERYSIRKLEIEKGLLGDDRVGLRDPDEIESGVVIPEQDTITSQIERRGDA